MKNETKTIKERIKNTFDEAALHYDTNEHFVRSAKQMGTLAVLTCKPDATILDLSTGTGHIAIEIATRLPNAVLHGVDISEQMLHVARQKSTAAGVHNVTYHCQDVEELELEESAFDLITCGYGLFFYPNLDATFCDIAKRVKSGGAFMFSTFTPDAFEPHSQLFLDMLKEDYDIYPPQRLEDRPLNTREAIKALAKQANPKSVSIETFEIRYDMSIPRWWELLNSTGYSGLLSQLTQAQYDAFEKRYLDALHVSSKNGAIAFNADSFFTTVRF